MFARKGKCIDGGVVVGFGVECLMSRRPIADGEDATCRRSGRGRHCGEHLVVDKAVDKSDQRRQYCDC